MSDQQIQCPSCATSIPLTEALSAKIKAEMQKDFLKQQEEKEAAFKKLQAEHAAELEKKEQSLLQEQKKLKEEKEQVEKQVEEKLQQEKLKMWELAQKKAEEKMTTELKDLKTASEEMKAKLEQAEKEELELRKKARALEEEKRSLDIEMQRKLDKEREEIRLRVSKEADEQNRLKTQEYVKQIEMMNRQIEDLKRKSQQGSQQLQGEVQEDHLKQRICEAFPYDEVEDVPQGVRGADLIQKVRNNFGKESGIILWESKNTKTWSGDWIKKLKDDQGLVQADVCMLVSKALPQDVEKFGLVDGVWVCDYESFIPLASTLRVHVQELDRAKQSLVGREEKMEMLYGYLSGSQFKNHVENIVLAFSSMKSDLETEKRSMQRIWSKREKEIERVIGNTSGMYGELQGIIGGALPTIQSLELPGALLEDEE